MRISFLLLLPLAASLSLTSHCIQSRTECRCSQHSSAPFCLSATTPSTCKQHKCHARYVCDCSGDTLCRITKRRTVLTCTEQVAASGICDCRRDLLREPSTALVPLREYRPLREPKEVLCSEQPGYWADEGRGVLRGLWDILIDTTEARVDRISDLPSLTFGHAGHAVSFTSADELSNALREHLDTPRPLASHFINPTHALDSLTAECSATNIMLKLMKRGIATRLHAHVDKFDAEKLVLQRCPLLEKDHPMVGMSLKRVLEIANMATGEFAWDDAGVEQLDVEKACKALNRNFEGCERDLGCVAVAE